jgi:hypothetical protein
VKVGPAPQQIAFGYKGLSGPNAYITVGGLNKVLVVGGEPSNMRILEEIPVGDRPTGSGPTRKAPASSSSTKARTIST